MQDLIEYLGLNVCNGKLLTEKYYYHWNNQKLELPHNIKCFLNPFDWGKRDHGFNYSISAFIKGCNSEKLNKLLDFGINTCHLVIDKTRFLDSFLYIADLSGDSHYDPIVSFKYNDGIVTGMSFYVTALKNKSLVFTYLERVKQKLSLDSLKNVSDIISFCVHSRFSDMFQVSWDFGIQPQEQNKIYLKVKDISDFSRSIKQEYPYLLDYMNVEGFRFCELAFVINDSKLKMFNLYFKPV